MKKIHFAISKKTLAKTVTEANQNQKWVKIAAFTLVIQMAKIKLLT